VRFYKTIDYVSSTSLSLTVQTRQKVQLSHRPRDASCHWVFRKVTQSHLRQFKMYCSKAWVRFTSYSHSTVMALLCIVSEMKRYI